MTEIQTEGIERGLLAVAASIDRLATAVTRVAYGTVDGPTGMETVGMAMAERGEPSVSAAIRDGLQEIAREVADAIDGLGRPGEGSAK